MTSCRRGEPNAARNRAAGNAARTLQYRAAYEQQLVIRDELVAEMGRLAAEIEAALTVRRPPAGWVVPAQD